MAKPLVSILIPCYNAEKWLAETLQSALAQTWEEIEVILVDDGSTDATLAVARSFESPIVQVMHQPHQGASVARNRLLQVAQGEYLQYLDADDLLHPDKIATQLLLLLQNPAGKLATCATLHFYDGCPAWKGKVETGLPYLVSSDDPVDWLIRLWGGDGAGGKADVASWLTPRAVADRAGLWDLSLSLDDDGEYFARVVLASTGIRRTDLVGCSYRKYRDRGSQSAIASDQAAWSGLRSLDLKSQHLLTRTSDPRASRALARSYMEWAVATYPAYPLVTEAALDRIKSLGGTTYRPALGGWKAELLGKLLGWKGARLASASFHQLRTSLTTSFLHQF